MHQCIKYSWENWIVAYIMDKIPIMINVIIMKWGGACVDFVKFVKKEAKNKKNKKKQ